MIESFTKGGQKMPQLCRRDVAVTVFVKVAQALNEVLGSVS